MVSGKSLYELNKLIPGFHGNHSLSETWLKSSLVYSELNKTCIMHTNKSFNEPNKLILGFLGDHSFELNIGKGHHLYILS